MSIVLPRRSLPMLPTLLVGATAACASSEDDHEYFMTGWYQGSLPLEERQTIEDYQKTVEPALGKFVTEVAQFSGPASILAASTLRKGIKGYQMYTASVNFQKPTDYGRTYDLLLNLFDPLGFEESSQNKDTLEILERKNGGYVHLIDTRKLGGISVVAQSGDRPTSTGDPRAHRVRPDWELAIPLNPGTYPSGTPEEP